MATKGDIAISSDGRTRARTSGAAAWGQQTKSAFGFTAGTYRHDQGAGFPASMTLFAKSVTVESLSALIRFAVSKRPNIAEIIDVSISHQDRHWTAVVEVRLLTGELVNLELEF